MRSKSGSEFVAEPKPELKAGRQLMRQDLFAEVYTDASLEAALDRVAVGSSSPYADALEALVGVEEPDEARARALVERIAAHRRELARALGRDVHVRVAALDLLTIPRRRRTDSQPILVTAHLLERALEEASSDPLTGLPQRGQFASLLAHELRQRNRRPLAVAFLDLDGFKRVNDVHGHAAGDEALRALAASARLELRQGDVLARVGGDEFALLLLDLDDVHARNVTTRLRERFEASTAAYGTSFSTGIVMAEPGDTPEEVLARADAAMYRDKRARAAPAGVSPPTSA